MGLPEHRLILFTGSRNWMDWTPVRNLFRHSYVARSDIVVAGGAYGLDAMVRSVAQEWDQGYYELRAPWQQFGKAAGRLRNEHMARLRPDYTYAFPLPESKGTWDMVCRIQAAGLPGQYWTPDGWETW